MSESATGPDYVRAVGKRGSVRVYDTVLKLSAREGRWRSKLLDRVAAGLPQGGTAVDVGAGTGTFAIALAGRRPDVTAIAVDGDESILHLARAKPGSEKVDWRAGLANELPLEDESANTVTMSLLLHHLSPKTSAPPSPKRGASCVPEDSCTWRTGDRRPTWQCGSRSVTSSSAWTGCATPRSTRTV
jgi:SAM-dependent methyltransferase